MKRKIFVPLGVGTNFVRKLNETSVSNRKIVRRKADKEDCRGLAVEFCECIQRIKIMHIV